MSKEFSSCYVKSEHVMRPNWPDESIGQFSSHWAAVAAFVRLRDPDFRSLDGDKEEDLQEEEAMRARLRKAAKS